ncbi:basic salivary proline-rich protein 1-like [Dipodomys merriami]|uniref:basic salivary proline-rich protein 1-like n=1 Tax=Dipodomys merriami TaxID=94247 RepID=UPI00384E2405
MKLTKYLKIPNYEGATPGLPPRGRASGSAHDPAPQRRRPALRPRETPGGAGGPGCGVGGGRARPPRGPPARGLARRPPSRRTPPHPGPRRPRRSPPSNPRTHIHSRPAGPPAVAAGGRPSGPQVPGPPPPQRRPHSPFHSPPQAWRGPANPRPHIRVRGAGSELGSPAPAATASPWAAARAFPCQPRRQGCRAAQEEEQPPTAPLPAPRGHNTREPLLGLRNDNLPTILEAPERGAGGRRVHAPPEESAPSHFWSLEQPSPAPRGPAGKKLGVGTLGLGTVPQLFSSSAGAFYQTLTLPYYGMSPVLEDFFVSSIQQA